MLYLLERKIGNAIERFIVEEPEVKDGTVYATKVGEPACYNDSHGFPAYKRIEPVKYIAGGAPFSLTEFKRELMK